MTPASASARLRAQRAHRAGAEQHRGEREPQPEHRRHRAREHDAEPAGRERHDRPAPARRPSRRRARRRSRRRRGPPRRARRGRGSRRTTARAGPGRFPSNSDDDPEELEQPPGRRGDAPGDHGAERAGTRSTGRAHEQHGRGEERRVPRELREADRVSREVVLLAEERRASRARPRRRGGTRPPARATTRARTSGCQPSRRPRSPAATSTQAIAASARVASIDVEPTPTETLGW